jgi:hypothetical protein
MSDIRFELTPEDLHRLRDAARHEPKQVAAAIKIVPSCIQPTEIC